jgi:glutamate decarboxylase
VKALTIPFIRAADEAVPSRAAGELLPNSQGVVQNALVDARRPADLVQELALSLPKGEGRGKQGLLEAIQDVLKYSVNTWDQGFMDKLYASTNPVRSPAGNHKNLLILTPYHRLVLFLSSCWVS